MKRVSTTNSPVSQACLHETFEPKVQQDLDKESIALESTCNLGFEKLLVETIDEAMSALGDSGKEALYFYLEKTFKVKKQEIPNKIEEFANAIERIFGDGAKILEIQIMKHLHEKVGQDFEYFPKRDELIFTEYVEAVRGHYTGFTPFPEE